MLLDCEIFSIVHKIMRCIQVDADTIMLDLIQTVGPGGSFLNQQRSASLCRKEAWIPSVLDRDPYNVWSRKGSLSTEDHANAKVERILETHQPKPLAPDVIERIEEILSAAEAREKK